MMGKKTRRLCILKSERNPKVKKTREGPSVQERKKEKNSTSRQSYESQWFYRHRANPVDQRTIWLVE